MELIKIRKLLIADDMEEENALLSISTRLILNTDESTVEESEYLLSSDEAGVSDES